MDHLNLYDRMFERLRAEYGEASAPTLVVDAYLDGKPKPTGKRKTTRRERDAAFWQSRFVAERTYEEWCTEPMTLALSRYFEQGAVACQARIQAIAAGAPQAVVCAVRRSGLVSTRHPERLHELARIGRHQPEIAELCRVLDVFADAHQLRLDEVASRRSQLAALSPFELLVYASLYAFEHLISGIDFQAAELPTGGSPDISEHWAAINDLFIWRLRTAKPKVLRLNEAMLARSLKAHLSPYLFPSPTGSPPRDDLQRAFAEAVSAQVELNSFQARSADAFSFDEGIEFIREGGRLEIVTRAPAVRERWLEESRRLARLNQYWFYRALEAFIERGLAEEAIGSAENFAANRLAYIRAIRTELQLQGVYGLGDEVVLPQGRRVPLFHALLALELTSAFYQRDFLQAYTEALRRTGHWASALCRLALGGLADGGQNRFPLSWATRNAKIRNIVGWTVTESEPHGSRAAAAAMLDFWTSDWKAVAARLRDGGPGIDARLFERPYIKLGDQLITLPWVFGLQNNASAAINNLRRLGARRPGTRDETQRIEQRLGSLFESRGFRVIIGWVPEDDVRAGEVDLICALQDTLLVLELKSTFLRNTQQEAWRHRTVTLRKAGRQLALKTDAVRRALARDDALRAHLCLPEGQSCALIGWVIDTSIESDHQRFDGFLKVSLEEVLIALRDDRHLMQDRAGVFSPRIPDNAIDNEPDLDARMPLYTQGFTAAAFVKVIESGRVWHTD